MSRLFVALALLANTVLAQPAPPNGQISGGPTDTIPEPSLAALAAVAVGYVLLRRRKRG